MKSMYVVAFETMRGMERIHYEHLNEAIHYYLALRKNHRHPSLYRA